MHEVVSFNSNIVAPGEPLIPALASAAMYAKGIFTTIAIYNREPFLWEKHWSRLKKDAVSLTIDISELSEPETRRTLGELLQKNQVANGRARLTLFDESASERWPYDAKHGTSLLIVTADARSAPKPIRLTISPHLLNSTSPLRGVKSCNYLEKILALKEVKGRGFDEAIKFNERGEITSACLANIFWLKDGRLFTPSTATGCLEGTTRAFVIENLDCEETVADIEVFAEADEIFLTSSGLGIIQVDELNGRRLGGHPHLITTLIEQQTVHKKIHETAR